MPKNLWNDTDTPQTDGLESRAYRSRLLGSDRSVVNIYGGNTSTKSLETDHTGRGVEVLDVKGSGSDIANITNQGFAALKLAEVLPLFSRPNMSDEQMTGYLDRTAFEVGRPRQSIETLLHAFIPAKHVDHTHPDAIIASRVAPTGVRSCARFTATGPRGSITFALVSPCRNKSARRSGTIQISSA